MTAGYWVRTEDEGRSGLLEYLEGQLRLPFEWEFLATGAAIPVPAAGEWDAYWVERGQAGAAGRRGEILERLAREVCRQKAPGARVTVHPTEIHLAF